MSKTIIVSNRLPVKLTDNEGEISFTPSEGGLATGLGSIYRETNNIWIGWPGMEIGDEAVQQKVQQELGEQNLKAVFLTQEEINHYYEGFSNEILWPVFHYMPTYARYHQQYWDYYYAVNEKFRDVILQNMEPGDTIWIHDYQLLLLPGLLRSAVPDATIGFFQHIPFPSFELFRMIPWRVELLDGLLGADLIGFHTFDDARHFVSAARGLTSAISSSNEISYNNRNIVVDSFPMGIDSKKFHELTKEPLVREYIAELKKSFENTRLILSIDRLDYSKGILQRLRAYELLLQLNPDYVGSIVLYMIVVPSRDNVQQYKELLDEIDKTVGGINARYRTMNWQPVSYFYRSLPVEELSALYATAEICLVTPMRDGMNLVCKEYIASRENGDGVLILSEMAGASKELSDAIIVNPNNIHAIMLAIEEALAMPLAEQKRRMQLMKEIVMKFNVSHWVKLFMTRLKEVKQMQVSMFARHISETSGNNIKRLYANAENRLIFLDYDGTLVGFSADIEMAAPDEELYTILEKLAEDPANRVVIVSGRNPEFLEKWFGALHIDMVAEHGAWTKSAHKGWQSLPGLNAQWKKEFFPVLEAFADRTPGAFIEEKDFSLVWHYRKVEESLGELRSNEIMSTLRYLAEDKGLQVLPGNKVVEIKNIEINKGKAALSFLQEGAYDFNMAIGDDYTDEDIFKALPSTAVSIKVGSQVSAARYSINDYREVRKFLKFLAGSNVFNQPAALAAKEK
ncbi:MAG TPA: bifunctional alpha,alpha-trehalose-phosphate synthase (UDP-forming)/trehalose-phosphatase [Flavitalea sp.]|nr:bifunctional alpha,alpha-trehalose-phosphate synthase (UDP-forming)/trehalose-phosphatase [Flavitalea sp.]